MIDKEKTFAITFFMSNLAADLSNWTKMSNERTHLRGARREEASRIAELIIMAMTEDCCLYLCGNKHNIEDFHRVMTSLVERDDSQYSYLNTICACCPDEDNVAGICTSYDGGMLHQLRRPFIEAARREWGMDHSDIADETQAGELYIDSLAVDPAYRGRGIAQMLLRASIQKAKDMNIPMTGLLVDVGNPKAEALYNKVGFELEGTNTWGGHDMRHLVLRNE